MYFFVLMCLLLLTGLFAAVVIYALLIGSIVGLIIYAFMYLGAKNDASKDSLLGTIGILLVTFLITGGIMLAIISKH